MRARLGPGRPYRLWDADRSIRPLLAHLTQAGDVIRLEVAGSVRRRQDAVGEIDLVAVCEHRGPLMERFTTGPLVQGIVRESSTRATVVLHSGLCVNLRIVPEQSYGAALHAATGSRSHQRAIRALGIHRGLRIDEDGVFEVAAGARSGNTAGKQVGGAEEGDVFRAAGLEWIPPELREGKGEIERAREQRLPQLLTTADIRGNLHMHSTWSDGDDSLEAMALACRDLGYEYCAITDHSRAARSAGGLDAAKFREQWKEIARIRTCLRGITLFAGVEVDILSDGSLDLPDDILGEMDVVVASVHAALHLTKRDMTARLVRAIRHPCVDIVGHPTARLLVKREPIVLDFEEVCRVAKDHGVALEVNGQPQRLDLNDVSARRAQELGVTLAVSSDAHSADQLRNMDYGVDQARRGWVEKHQVANAMDLPAFERWLRR